MIIAGTGHRPKYCPCLYNENHEWLISLRGRIRKELEEHSPEAVISGMAIGFDTWLAEEAMKLGIDVHAYIPFEGQGGNWPRESQERYQKILDYSAKHIYIAKSYTNQAFIIRDRMMVEDSHLVLALLNKELIKSGTYYTVSYAKSKNRPVINLWENYE
jgi:uncharacterized phage-like protein YoqJ